MRRQKTQIWHTFEVNNWDSGTYQLMEFSWKCIYEIVGKLVVESVLEIFMLNSGRCNPWFVQTWTMISIKVSIQDKCLPNILINNLDIHIGKCWMSDKDDIVRTLVRCHAKHCIEVQHYSHIEISLWTVITLAWSNK